MIPCGWLVPTCLLHISFEVLCVDLLLGFVLEQFVQKSLPSDYPVHDDRNIRSVGLSDVRAPDYPTGFYFLILHILILTNLDSIILEPLDSCVIRFH